MQQRVGERFGRSGYLYEYDQRAQESNGKVADIFIIVTEKLIDSKRGVHVALLHYITSLGRFLSGVRSRR